MAKQTKIYKYRANEEGTRLIGLDENGQDASYGIAGFTSGGQFYKGRNRRPVNVNEDGSLDYLPREGDKSTWPKGHSSSDDFYSDGVLQIEGGYLGNSGGKPKYKVNFNETPIIPTGTKLPASFQPFAKLGSELRPISPSPTTETTKPTTGTRVNSEGVVQKGMDLDAINSLFKSQSDKGMMRAGDLGESSKYFSNALPVTEVGTLQLGKPFVEGAKPTQKPDVSDPFQPDPQLQTEFPEGTTPFAPTDKYTPYSTGGKPSNAQDGSSPKPDRVERIRQVAFNGADFSGDEPDDSSLVSPMYANSERNKARAAFLDPANKGYNAIRARDRAVGAFHQYDKGGVVIDGEIQEFNKGMSRDARFELSGGLNSTEQAQSFKDKYLKGVQEATSTTSTEVETPASTTEVETPASTSTPVETVAPSTTPYKPIWTTKTPPSSGASKEVWDKHFADLDANHRL